MASPLSLVVQCLRARSVCVIPARGHKFHTKKPRPKPMHRRVFDEITKPIIPHTGPKFLPNSCLDPRSVLNKEKESNPYEEFLLSQLRQRIESSRMVIVCHRLPCNPLRSQLIKVALQKHDMKIQIGNRQHMRLLTEGTKLAHLQLLTVSDFSVITCPEIKVIELMDTMKKFSELIILGGFVFDRLVTRDMLTDLSKLPSIEQLRGNLVACLNHVRGSRILSSLGTHQQTLSVNLEQYHKQMGEGDGS